MITSYVSFKNYWKWVVGICFVSIFNCSVAQTRCSGNALVDGNIDFGSHIQVKDSDPYGMVIKEVPFNMGMHASCSVPPTEGFHSESSGIGAGRGVAGSYPKSNLSQICQSGVPGLGYQIVFNGPGSGYLWEFGPRTACNYVSPPSFSHYPAYSASSIIAPGAISVRLIKIGNVSKKATMLPAHVFSFFRGPFSLSIGANPAIVSSQPPTCNFTSASRVVNLGQVDLGTLQNGNASYVSFDLPFNCEEGARLDLMQLMVDGAGVSIDQPGLVTPDNNAGAAQNVLIEVVNANQQRLEFKKNFPASLTATNGSTPLKARLYKDPSKPITPGKVSANLTVTFTQP